MGVVFDDTRCSALQREDPVDAEVQMVTVKCAGGWCVSVGRPDDFTPQGLCN